MYGERTVWNPNARDSGQDATHVTANTTLPRRPRSRLRANASRADASGKISTDGRRSAPASASLAIDHSSSRFGSTVKYSPPSGGSSATETSRPPGRSTAPDRRSRSPPTVSNTRSTGATASSKPVAASTASCAPSSRTSPSSVAAAVPTTYASRLRASWTARPPTAPAAPWMSTRSPGASRPWSNSPCQAVSVGRGTAALSARLSDRGLAASTSAGTIAKSAATPSLSNGVSAKTSAPGATPATPGPASSTTPASSYDGIAGKRSTGHYSSLRVIAAACTRMSVSPGPGRGRPASSTASCSGPPGARSRTTRIETGPPSDAVIDGPGLAVAEHEEGDQARRHVPAGIARHRVQRARRLVERLAGLEHDRLVVLDRELHAAVDDVHVRAGRVPVGAAREAARLVVDADRVDPQPVA